MPEYGLLPVVGQVRAAGSVVLAPRDHTAALRYSWQPTAAAAADPARAAALGRLSAALTGPAADEPLARAGLRRPGGGPPPGADGLPAVQAPLFDVLGPHHVDHVLASWYAADRRSDLLVAVDVSGSMGARAPGSDRALIDIVRDGVGELASLLPDDSQLTLWRFGTHLDGAAGLRAGAARHDARRRGPRGRVAGGRAARPAGDRDGPARHDPRRVRGGPRRRPPGRPEPRRRLHRRAQRGRPAHAEPRSAPGAAGGGEGSPWRGQRPVELTVVAFGGRPGAPEKPEVAALAAALEPVGGYLDALQTANQVKAAFIHAAAGGIHE